MTCASSLKNRTIMEETVLESNEEEQQSEHTKMVEITQATELDNHPLALNIELSQLQVPQPPLK